jgi:hypothetical protein
MFETIAGLVKSFCFGIVATMGINLGTHEPKYEVIQRLSDKIEVRTYAPRLAAETEVNVSASADPSREAFGILAGYIFGANRRAQKIEMTAPVEINTLGLRIAMTTPVESKTEKGVVAMRFFMPAEFTLANLPEPINPRVKLIEIPAITVAAIRFSGVSDRRNEEQIAALMSALAATPWKPDGPPTAYYYNPPWTVPFLRRNEVVIPVTL